MQLTAVLLAVAVLCAAGTPAVVRGEAEDIYQRYCAQCHGVLRYGGYAPPLIAATLKRRAPADLQKIIRDGLPQTQMPAFGPWLSAEQIDALASYVRAPAGLVSWTERDMMRSRISFATIAPARVLSSDRQGLVLVVERGTGSIVVLRGRDLRQVDKFSVGRIHGGPKFSQDHALVFAATRDGTLVKYDLLRGQVAVKVKVAVNTRNIAISGDGRWVAAANQLPQNLVVLDGGLRPLRIFPLGGKPSAVYLVPQGDRFLLSLRDIPQLMYLEMPSLTLRQVELPQPFEDFTFVPERNQILASSRGGKQILLYDIDTGRVVRQLPTTGLPHLFSTTFFVRQGKLYAALNHIGVPRLSIIDMDAFRLEKRFELVGAGYFVRTHPATPYLWVDTNTERIQLFDKESLTPIDRDLVPEAGKKAMHVAFTADGRRAMVSIWHKDGAVVVYDSASLAELQRLPFNMPVGKYNARNKTHFPLR